MTALQVAPAGLALLVLLNLAAFLAFALDKALARRRGRRIAEATLLWLALAGGTPGAYAGRRSFRHKTRKQPFVGRLHAIAVLQSTALAAAAWLLLR
jgi:uncharacterized membrane protein YsdA (DUF1294 family)